MSKWAPSVALIGLVGVMVLPTPSVRGIAIGSCRVLAIALSAAMLHFERAVDRVAKPFADAFRRPTKPKSHDVNAGSGMARKR